MRPGHGGMLLVKTRLYWVSVALTPMVDEVKVIGRSVALTSMIGEVIGNEHGPNSNGWSLCTRRGSNREESHLMGGRNWRCIATSKERQGWLEPSDSFRPMKEYLSAVIWYESLGERTQSITVLPRKS